MGAVLALLVVVVYPVCEVALAAWVAARIGWGPVLALFLLGLIAGVLLMRHSGRRAAEGLRVAARQGSLPGGDVGDSALLFLAGALLALPGFLTDLAGLALLVPALRGFVRRLAGATVGRRIAAGGYSVTTATVDGVTVTRLYEGDVIPGEVVPPAQQPPGPAEPTTPPPALPPH